MTHYRSLMDHEFLGAWDLQRDGRPVEVTITIGAVGLVDVFDPKNPGAKEKTRKLAITPKERPERKLIVGKTNGDLIAALHGTDCDAWIGKRITLYPAETTLGRERVEAIRVKVPEDLLRDSPRIRSRVRKKLLAELGWTLVTAPKSREARGFAEPAPQPTPATEQEKPQ